MLLMEIEIHNPHHEWQQVFEIEKIKLEKLFEKEMLSIHHIGSTAVPGLKAKPIIDILLVVENIEKVNKFNKRIEGLGYEALGENGIKGRRFFIKGEKPRTHHIHVFQKDNSLDINRHLAVRNYLIYHHDVANEYGKLKVKLAQQFPNDRTGYCNGKDHFLKQLEQKALEWDLKR